MLANNMKTFILLTAMFAVAYCLPLSDIETKQWNDFKSNHGKTYATAEEEAYRLQTFLQTLREVQEHNAKYEASLTTYTKGINQFSDMTHEEFVKTMLSPFNLTEAPTPSIRYLPPAGYKAPEEVDWRQKGAVTGIKDQGQTCSSCWSFSATGALEGQIFIKQGQLISLSEQNLIDCSRPEGSGCQPWFPSNAFDFIQQQGGIDTEDSYPYEGVNNLCRYSSSSSVTTTGGSVAVSPDEDSLAVAIATVGPISVGINADNLQGFGGGIIFDNCDSNIPNHAVLAVGYGSEGGRDYWIVKNSWGTGWGDDGYFLLARNAGNACGIASYATYPLV